MAEAIAHLKRAEEELAEAIRALGVGTIEDRRLSFVALLVIVERTNLEAKAEAA